jgi:ABC-type sulfate/molybdate transport systems ATPase subunit
VSELSGGERSRLELAILGVTPANLLLLDEPTNHLDIPAREALESFLRDFRGTVLVVSHDRRLLDTVCERLFVVEPAPGAPARFAAFEGRWREWRSAVAEGWTVAAELELQSRRLDGVRRTRDAAASSPAATRPVAPARSRVSRGDSRLSKDAYRRQKEVIEADLTRLGLRKNHLELALGRPDVQANFVELRRLSSELADVDAALGQAEDAWLTLEERAPR